jgi:hypothetical protein
MPYSHTLADVGASMFYKELVRRVAPLLAEHGASEPGELPAAVRRECLCRVVQSLAANFPAVNPQAVDHVLASVFHPAFVSARERIRLASKGGGNAFEMARGIHAAVVLAGFGLPVAPFDLARGRGRILEKPSNDIDTVLQLFSRDKGAFVGYSTCAAPFYLLLTNCVRTLRKLVPVHPELAEVRSLYAHARASLPADPGRQYVPGIAMFARQPGDTISSIGVHDVDALGVRSIILQAGWEIDGQPFGASHEGYQGVPLQLLRAVVDDPRFAFSLCGQVSASPAVH